MDVIKENTTQPNPNILREAVVLLGDQKTYLMESPLRLIECLDGEGNLVRILTNDFNLESDEISELYRKRWQIELFFKHRFGK
ncbi:transposase [Paenibacillus germinis]